MNKVPLGELMPSRIPSVNPAKHLDETFELWSIPAFDQGEPECLKGSEIGSSKKCVEPDDVLLSRIVPHIRRSWVVGPVNGSRQIASGEWITFRSSRVFPPYLRHVLISDEFHAQFMRTVAGVGGSLVRARPEGVKQIEIPLPPLDEQKRIAAILDQADALRRLRQRAIDRLNTLGQAIFYEMFGRNGGAKSDQIALGELLTFVTSGGRGWAKYYCDEGARFLRSLDVQMNAIGNDDVAFVDPPDNAEARRTRTERGDVLLTITGSKIGRAAPLPNELAGSYISQHVAILRPDTNRVLPSFLSYFLSMEQFGQRQIKAKQYGQAKPGLNFEQIRSFRLPNVSIEQQRAFVDRLKKISNVRAISKDGVKNSDALFASLQHRAFRGEL